MPVPPSSVSGAVGLPTRASLPAPPLPIIRTSVWFQTVSLPPWAETRKGLKAPSTVGAPHHTRVLSSAIGTQPAPAMTRMVSSTRNQLPTRVTTIVVLALKPVL